MKNKAKKDEAGFGVIEITVALAIVSFLLVVWSSLALNTSQSFNNIDKMSNAANVLEALKLTLGSQPACTKNLKGIPMDSSITTASPMSQIKDVDVNGNFTSAVAVVGSNDRGLMLKSMGLRFLAKVDTSVVVAQLIVAFQNPTNANGPDIVRSIPIFANVQGKAVTSCWERQDFGSAQANQICQFTSGGALTTYDPTVGCTLPGGKWYAGSLTTASCPAGTVLPDNATDSNCNGVPAANFVDTIGWVNVTYTNGATQPISRPPFQAVLIGKSCSCGWGTDLSPDLLAGATCQILCVTP